MSAYVIEDIGSRDYMEDRHSVEFNLYENYDYHAVFDGHGGSEVSTFLKLYYKEILRQELKNNPPEKALYESFKIISKIIPQDIATHTGSTAIVVLRKKNQIWCANIGDSRIICNNGLKTIELSEDHKPDTKKEYERIEKLGGVVSKDSYGTSRVMGNLAVSRSVGDFYLWPYVTWTPDIIHINLNKNNNFIVMGSDGVWDVLSSSEVVNIVHDVRERMLCSSNNMMYIMQKVCVELLSIARKRKSGDNITILLIFL